MVAVTAAGFVRDVAARLSATMQLMSMVVSSRGGVAVALEMEWRGRMFDDDGCLVLALVLDDTVVPATDGVEEVPPVP